MQHIIMANNVRYPTFRMYAEHGCVYMHTVYVCVFVYVHMYPHTCDGCVHACICMCGQTHICRSICMYI